MTSTYNQELLELYHTRRKQAIEYLGSECSICGSVYELEIDHKDWKTKEINLGKDWYQFDKWWEEIITKCQLLCRTHHQEKTILDLKEQNTKDRSLCHGTVSQYTRYKCRCDECRKAYSQYKKEYRLRNGETQTSYKSKW